MSVIRFPGPTYLKAISSTLKSSLDGVALAVDYVMAAERQIWRVIANTAEYDAKVYELALMIAVGNIEDAIAKLTVLRMTVQNAIDTVRKST